MKYKEHRRRQVFYILLLLSLRERNFRSMDPILSHEDKAWEKSVVIQLGNPIFCVSVRNIIRR